MSRIAAVVIVQGPMDEARLIRHCNELESLLDGPNYDPDVFRTGALILDSIFETYFENHGLHMSDFLRQKVMRINWLTVRRGLRPMLRLC